MNPTAISPPRMVLGARVAAEEARRHSTGPDGAVLDGGMGLLSIAILYPTPDAGEDDFLALAGRITPQVEAVLLPETALHASTITGQLERAAGGVPVLTATQVSLWHAAALAGLKPHAADSGPLFELARETT